ncbi:MAG: TatD family hydrolase, partial [Ruminococcus sp.]|nr:TatD family hydrolase [Ruminococcus sp.]
LETDAPYMAPVPFRGKRCDSSMIVYAAEKIAALRGLTVQELLDITAENARHSVEVAADIPLDRLLLETDAPYMSPVPFRGKRCDSSMIIYAAEKIAALRGIGTQELLNITAENAKRFYSIES